MTRQLDSLRAFVGDRTPQAWRRMPHVVVVAGGKGGVGTSTASALIAAGAARQGHATLLVDAAGGNTTLDALLGDASRVPMLALEMIPGAHELSSAERRALLRRLSGRYDAYELVVVDAGSTCDGVAAALSAGAGRLLAVTAEDRITLTATYALAKFATERFERLPIAVLANRCGPAEAAAAFGHIATAVEQFLGGAVTPAGSVPDDEAIAAGHTLLSVDGPAAHAAALLAELLMHAGRGGHGRSAALQAMP